VRVDNSGKLSAPNLKESNSMRIALGIEYNGAKYYGWQRQKEVISVQEVLEGVVSKIANHQVDVFCAGRTDSGVHATGQVIHFDTTSIRDMKGWSMGVNSNLPDDIAVRWAQPVSDDFHARYSATARRYRYIIYNNRMRPGILRAGLSHYPMPLDEKLMQAATACLLGENDFTSFRAVHCQAKTPHRFIHHVKISRQNDYVIIDIKANAFLHHMVRNIAGSLITIGLGQNPVSWMEQVLHAKDRTKAAATAKAGGLYMIEVDYPTNCNIPKSIPGPLFL
jgi:tRNA pseudouridine38-40 synthase